MRFNSFLCGCLALPKTSGDEQGEIGAKNILRSEIVQSSGLAKDKCPIEACVDSDSLVFKTSISHTSENGCKHGRSPSGPGYMYTLPNPRSSSSRALVGGVEYNSFFVNPLAEGSHEDGTPIAYAGASIAALEKGLPNPLAEEFSNCYATPPDSPSRTVICASGPSALWDPALDLCIPAAPGTPSQVSAAHNPSKELPALACHQAWKGISQGRSTDSQLDRLDSPPAERHRGSEQGQQSDAELSDVTQHQPVGLLDLGQQAVAEEQPYAIVEELPMAQQNHQHSHRHALALDSCSRPAEVALAVVSRSPEPQAVGGSGCDVLSPQAALPSCGELDTALAEQTAAAQPEAGVLDRESAAAAPELEATLTISAPPATPSQQSQPDVADVLSLHTPQPVPPDAQGPRMLLLSQGSALAPPQSPQQQEPAAAVPHQVAAWCQKGCREQGSCRASPAQYDGGFIPCTPPLLDSKDQGAPVSPPNVPSALLSNSDEQPIAVLDGAAVVELSAPEATQPRTHTGREQVAEPRKASCCFVAGLPAAGDKEAKGAVAQVVGVGALEQFQRQEEVEVDPARRCLEEALLRVMGPDPEPVPSSAVLVVPCPGACLEANSEAGELTVYGKALTLPAAQLVVVVPDPRAGPLPSAPGPEPVVAVTDTLQRALCEEEEEENEEEEWAEGCQLGGIACTDVPGDLPSASCFVDGTSFVKSACELEEPRSSPAHKAGSGVSLGGAWVQSKANNSFGGAMDRVRAPLSTPGAPMQNDPGCSISGLAMTRLLIRQLGLLPGPRMPPDAPLALRAALQVHQAAAALVRSCGGCGADATAVVQSPFECAREAAVSALLPTCAEKAGGGATEQPSQQSQLAFGRAGTRDGGQDYGKRLSQELEALCRGDVDDSCVTGTPGVGEPASGTRPQRISSGGGDGSGHDCGGGQREEEAGEREVHDMAEADQQRYSFGSMVSSSSSLLADEGCSGSVPVLSTRSLQGWLEPQGWKPLREKYGGAVVVL